MARTLAGGAGVTEPPIRIAAAVLMRGDGRTLLVRKRGTVAFMQAGGKIEPGETPVAAVCREVREELGLALDAARLGYLGRFVAAAANEAGRSVEAELFIAAIDEAVFPAAEIDGVAWVGPCAAIDLPLAPLTEDHVLPIARLMAEATQMAGSLAGAMTWLSDEPLPGWGARTALDLIRSGQASDVLDWLSAVRAGIYA